MHGAAQCGLLSWVAIPFTIAALVLETLVFGAPQGDHVVRMILWLVALVVAIILTALVLWLHARYTRRPDRL